MENSIRLLACLTMVYFFLLVGCKSKSTKDKQLGMVKDSCNILVMTKPIDKVNQNSVDNPLKEDTLIDLVIRLETEKKGFEVKELLFGMEKKFELELTSGKTMFPIFCQPIATGSNSKYSYWVSFEPLKKDWKQGLNTLIIHGNPLIKDSIHYIL